MSDQTNHPSHTQLTRYSGSFLSAEELLSIDQHVFNCSECAMRLAALMRQQAVETMKDLDQAPIFLTPQE